MRIPQMSKPCGRCARPNRTIDLFIIETSQSPVNGRAANR
jgi:hypothetical protein